MLLSGLVGAVCKTGTVNGHYTTTETNYTCTITYQPNSTYGQDARVLTHATNPTYANMNLGTDAYFETYAWTWSGVFVLERSLLKFDLTPLNNVTNVTSATLYLFNDGVDLHGQGNSIYSNQSSTKLSRLSSTWTQNNVTWNIQPGISNSSAILINAPSALNGNLTVDVTSHITSWVTMSVPNYGWRYSLQTENTYRSTHYKTSEYIVSNMRPRLVVVYPKN